MKKLIFLSLFVIAGLIFMSANLTFSSSNYEYVSVDTDPGAPGYYTAEINPKYLKFLHNTDAVFFSIRGTFVGTVTLQYKCVTDATWTDYAEYTDVDRLIVGDKGDGVLWRAGVTESANYTSGTAKFGFDW